MKQHSSVMLRSLWSPPIHCDLRSCSRTRLCIIALAVVFATTGCLDMLGLGSDLDTSFVVVPEVVSPGDSLTATLVLRNSSSDTATLSGAGCIAALEVLRRGSVLSLGHTMQGADFACTAGMVEYQVPPHDSLVVRFPLRAMLRSGSRASYTVLPDSGVYTLRTQMTVDLPNQECEFRVVH